MNRTIFFRFCIGFLSLIAIGCQQDVVYPSQPITLLCPWSAGGGTDRVSRQIAMQLEQSLGVPVNVINATGGSGVTGHTRGAQARPDGYTLAMVTVELNMLHWRGLTSITYEDFEPLQLLNRDSAAIFVLDESPIETLDELEVAIGERPGEIKASGTAAGGIWHVAVAGWLNSRGGDPTAANWISINGAGPSVQELNAGGLDFICCSLPEVDAMLASGAVRCLGVMADQRIEGFEQVPTFKEQGHQWSLAGWRGLAVPIGLPEDRVEVLQSAMRSIGQSDELRDFMMQAGFNLSIEGPEDFRATLASQDEIFEEVLTGPAFQSMQGDSFGPFVFPFIVGLAACGLIVLMWITGESPQENAGRGEGSIRGAILTLSACCFYLLVSESLGFVLAVGLTLVVMLTVHGKVLDGSRFFRFSLPFSFVCSAVLYQLFAVGLRVPLPRGLLGW